MKSNYSPTRFFHTLTALKTLLFSHFLASKNKIRFTFIFLIGSFPILAQKTQKIPFVSLSIESGLSQATVTCLFQDKYGLLWLGTQDGLNCYDAYNFKIYRHIRKDSTSLPEKLITALYETKAGELWVGTPVGFSAFDRNFDNFRNYYHNPSAKQTLSSSRVTAFAESRTGEWLWIGTDSGLNRFRLSEKENATATIEEIKLPEIKNRGEKPLHQYVNRLFVDRKGLIWVGTQEGLFSYDEQKNKFTHYGSDSTLQNRFIPNDFITGFTEDTYGSLWVATQDGLLRYDRLSNKFLPIRYTSTQADFDRKRNQIHALAADKKGYLWLATEGGLTRFSTASYSFEHYRFDKKNQEGTLSVYVDRSGIIWVGTKEGGVLKINIAAQHFKNLRHDAGTNNSLSHDAVWSIKESPQHHIFIGHSVGIDKMERDSIADYRKLIGEVKYAHALGFVSEYNILIGSKEGLYQYELDLEGKLIYGRHHLNDKEDSYSISHNSINVLYKDRYNIWWVGTAKGLNRIYLDSLGHISGFKRYNATSGNANWLQNDFISHLKEDKKGNLWISTHAGLYKAGRNSAGDIVSFEAFIQPPQNGMATNQDNQINSFTEDKNGDFWLATKTGLIFFSPKTKTFTHLGDKFEAANYLMYGILEGNDEALWASSNNGLIRYLPKDSSILVYNVEDGLQGDEFNSGSFLKDSRGFLYFGGVNGLTYFHPDSISANTYHPPLILTDFKIFNKSVEVRSPANPESPLLTHISDTREIKLSYQDKIFTIEFSALNYHNPKKTRYRYKLEGFEEEWNEVGNRRFATYSNLPAGTYIFKVRAASADKVWSETGADLTIIISPPFWRTTWFWVLVSVTVVSGVALFFHQRNAYLKRQNAALKIAVEEATLQLHQSNEELKVQNERIQRNNDNLEVLNKMGRQIAAELELDALINVVQENLQTLMPADSIGIAIYDPDNKLLVFPNSVEAGRLLPAHSVHLQEEELAAQCFNKQKEIFIRDIETEYAQYFSNKPLNKVGETTYSIVYVPLSIEERRLGVLTVQSFQKFAYEESHVSMLKNLANYIATALNNADAYRKIAQQKQEIELQNKIIQKRNQDITDSINYAKRIQDALLPQQVKIQAILPNHFILYMPRDIVSGDFYWFSHKKDLTFLAAIDCTGHGVPGAFVSIMADAALNQIINHQNFTQPHEILTLLDKKIRENLKQQHTQSRDGMDIALCMIDHRAQKLHFSGAHRPLFYFQEGKLHEVKATARSIGGFASERDRRTLPSFEQVSIDIRQSTRFYLSSDGYQDQFGGPEGRKLMKKGFKRLLEHIQPLSFSLQEEELRRCFYEWKGKNHQVDDVLVIGFEC
jgi:ligand-binding sensor domain-containing protein/serine phosphatase RsbU (regulator of sigma subunit)